MPSELVKCKKCSDYYDFRLDWHVCKGDEKKMSGWISTGKMIDQLQVGQVAECKQSDMTVTKGETGQILVTTTNDYTFPLTLNFKTAEAQWRILPNYVSFGEAMLALKKGKFVYFHPKENESISAHKDGHMTWLTKFMWNELLEGKWTIEGA